ncbi:MAG: hypothetical protein CL910_13240 [Deltaproteobacteria bacterium]|jgi:TPR repeat protein|nr:hypothetical protein [Deltaproteobacteria bacterium]
MRSLFVPLFFLCLLAISGCARAPRPAAAPVCEGAGCADPPGASTSADSSTAAPDSGRDARIVALEELAREDPRAAYDLGLRYFRGDGVPRDGYRALQWMRDAAGRGDFEAQKAVGRFYLTGLEEMGSDPREAQKWLSVAASRGDRESQTLLEEATAALESEAEYVEWSTQWRSVFYRHWYHDYPYRWRWSEGRWHD